MSFNAPIITLEDDPINCPTKVYNWIKIVEYRINGEINYYLCMDKRVINQVDIYNSAYRNLIKIKLPDSKLLSLKNVLLNYLIVRRISDSGLKEEKYQDMNLKFSNKYYIFEIIETNNFIEKYNGKIKITTGDFENVDIWNDFTQNEEGLYIYNFFTSPSLFKKNQKKIKITISQMKLLAPVYTNPSKEIYYTDNYISDAYFKFKLRVSPNSKITLKLNSKQIVSNNNGGQEHTKITILPNNIDTTYFTSTLGLANSNGFELNNISPETFDRTILNTRLWIPYTIDKKGNGKLIIHWAIESTDTLYNNISGVIELSIIHFLFRLNYSNSSFQTNLNIRGTNGIYKFENISKNQLIPTSLGNFNSIVMNKDSKHEYLILENFPHDNVLNDTFTVDVISSNENVLKSFTSKLLCDNTSELLKLQRFGDPRDYINKFSLLNLSCTDSGITKIFLKIKNDASNLTIDCIPFYICSIGLTVYKQFDVINTTSKDKSRIEIKPVCFGNQNLIKYLFNQQNFLAYNLLNSKQKIIPDENIFNKLILEYLQDVSLKPEVDISLNYNKDITDENVFFEIHTSSKKIDTTDCELIVDHNKKNGNTENGISFEITGKKNGVVFTPSKFEMYFLVNSLMPLTSYLKKSLTFSRPPPEPSEKNEYIENIWPLKNIINGLKKFDKGINDENKYIYTSILDNTHFLCNDNTYGQNVESLYDREFIWKTNKTEISNIVKEVTDSMKSENDVACILNYGKIINGVLDKKYWIDRKIYFDFYIRKIAINKRKFIRKKIEKEINFAPTISFKKQQVINTINRIYYENGNFHMYFTVSGEFTDFDSIVNTSIKLKNFKDEFSYFNDELFVIINKVEISEKKLYLFILKSNTELDDIKKQKEFKKNQSKTFTVNNTETWVNDDTVDINTQIYNYTILKKNEIATLEANALDSKEKVNNLEKKIIREEKVLNDRRLDLLNYVDDILINEIELNFEQLLEDIKKLKEKEAMTEKTPTVHELIDTYEGDTGWKETVIKFGGIEYNEDSLKKKQNKFVEEFAADNDINSNQFKLLDKKRIEFEKSVRELDVVRDEIIKNQQDEIVVNIKPERMSNIDKEYTWLYSPIKENIINTPKIPKKWYISKERYKIVLKTIVYRDKKIFIYEHDTNLTEIEDIDLYIKSLRDIQNDEANGIKKDISELDKNITNLNNLKKELIAATTPLLDAGEKIGLYNLQILKNERDIKTLQERLSVLVKLGFGGLNYIKNIDNKWFYLWKEWRIDYNLYNKPIDNFNEILKYHTTSDGTTKNISLYCSGKKYLKINTNSIQTKIKLNNINNMYSLDTIYTIIENGYEEYGVDNYILTIKPLEISPKLNSELSIFDELPYWSVYEVDQKRDIMEDNSDDVSHTIVDGRCVIKRDEQIINTGEPSDTITGLKERRIPDNNIGLRWAKSTDDIVETLKDLSNTKFTVGVDDRDTHIIEIYSKIQKDETLVSTMDNYYKNTYFQSMPLAKFEETTYSIYTNGASNTKHMYNTQPCLEFFHCSKLPKVSFEIISIPVPQIHEIKFYKKEIIFQIFEMNSLNRYTLNNDIRFEIYKIENTSDNPEWKLIDTIKDNYYKDSDVIKYNTYSYKIKSIFNYKNKLIESVFSNIADIFVCGDKNFETGRYNVKLDLNRNLDCNSNARPLNLYTETKHQMTKREIFAFLAKKKGGGIFR